MRRSLLVLMTLLAGCGSGTADLEADTAPTTTLTAPTTVLAEPTTTKTETTSTTLDEWESVRPWRGGPAGEYRTTAFEPPFSFSTPSAFQADQECAEGAGIIKTQGDEFNGILFLRLGPDTVEGTVEFFSGLEEMTLGAASPTEVGGADGVALQASLNSNLVMSAPCDTNSWLFSAGTKMTLYIVDVDGAIVTIWVDEIPGVPEEDIQGMLDSVVWRDLP